MQKHFDRLGAPPFDAADKAYAAKIQATLTDEDIESSYLRAGIPRSGQMPLCDLVVPAGVKGLPMIGSTDLGDVSWVVPTIEARVATHAIGTPGHSWQITAQGKVPAAHKGMVHAAKVMASVAADCITDAGLIKRAKTDFAARTAKTPYDCPLPADCQPNLQPRPQG
jgi:aminobenzoyl-glutamate utilization protein B